MRQLRQAPDALHSNARASAVTLSGMVGFPDFDRYVEEHGIPEEHYPAAFALWYAEATGDPVPSFEKVERAKEHPQIEGDDLWPAALLPT